MAIHLRGCAPEPAHRRNSKSSLMKFFVCFALVPSLAAASATSGTDNPAVLVSSRHGAVAADHRLCSDTGVQILKAGGNAVDAAISSVLCLGVVQPFSSGIGGGGWMTVRAPANGSNTTSEIWSIDFREIAPGRANTTMYQASTNSSQFGGLAVGIPGELRGLEEAHKRWGSLPWKLLFQPAIDLANGYRIGPELAKRIPTYKDLMLTNPDWSPIWAPHGVLLKENDIYINKNLSKTLSTIADDGPDAFYKGHIADSLVRKIQATGGIATNADFENYTVNAYRSLQGTYLGKKVYLPKAPGSGAALLHMLNIVEHYNFTQRDEVNTHRLVEAVKYGFAARTRLSDPKFRNASNLQLIDEVPTKEFADAVVRNITDDRTHDVDYYNPIYDIKPDHGTTHLAVVDKNGMAVSLTTTINAVFGSQVLDPATGVILNDEMDDFSTPGRPNLWGLWPSPFNYPEPHKRPQSSTVPTIIENPDGSLYMVVGGAGGLNILSAVFQVIVSTINQWGGNVDGGNTLGEAIIGEAIEAGRLHDQLLPAVTILDSTYPDKYAQSLQAVGHNITRIDVNVIQAVINGITRDASGVLYAASDSRKNGIASGF
ncbi:gamma-glutamyltranspeptidase [Marasmius fiardii PR-910]|nr:gamma-glutamyltranspeptidase [Marasmius fiardii PR-910]